MKITIKGNPFKPVHVCEKWTPLEDEIILDVAKTSSNPWRELSHRLHRSPAACLGRHEDLTMANRSRLPPKRKIIALNPKEKSGCKTSKVEASLPSFEQAFQHFRKECYATIRPLSQANLMAEQQIKERDEHIQHLEKCVESLEMQLAEARSDQIRAAETISSLRAYARNLNGLNLLLVNAHLSEGDRNFMHAAPAILPATANDHTGIDDQTELYACASSSLLSATRGMNPSSLLDPTFQRSLVDSTDIFDNTSELMGLGRVPYVSQPREVREVPIEVRDGNENSASQLGQDHGPRILDVTDIVTLEGPVTRGTIIIDEEDDDGMPRNLRGGQGVTRLSDPHLDDTTDYGNDIEEEIIRAAIETSRTDAELQNNEGLDHDGPHPKASQADNSSSQHKKDAGGLSLSLQDEVDELDEEPPVRHRLRRRSPGPVEAEREIREAGVSPVARPPPPTCDSQAQVNGRAFASPELGGISCEEHDEAVMLEAATFCGIPESGYHVPYAAHQPLHPEVYTSWSYPCAPSPNLVAQRSIREQQDDDYLALLQAEKEKELKANEGQNAAGAAALEEQKRKDEEAQRKVQEEQVRPYPRQEFSDGESSLSLIELGLTSKQEALFLEKNSDKKSNKCHEMASLNGLGRSDKVVNQAFHHAC